MKPVFERTCIDFRQAIFLLILSMIVCGSCVHDHIDQAVIMQEWATIDLFSEETETVIDQLPIRVDIEKAVVLGVHNMNSQFDRDKQDEPYFYCLRRADGTGEMKHNVVIGIPHIVGRSMLGSQIAQLKVGVPFPQEGFDIYERYCKQSFDNPDHLNSYYEEGRRGVEMHNMREGLWSLWALIVGRNSEWARDKAHKMLESLDSMTDAEGRWSAEMAAKQNFRITGGIMPDNQSRMLDPLLSYYDATNDELALKLAGMYARVGLDALFDSEGKFTPFGQSSGHIHSITSSLSGITHYAVFTNDQGMIDQCIRIMENGVPEYFSTWGWGDEVMPDHPANVISQGEVNQTGDVIRTALYLGAAGYTNYYELAERYLRSMLLPSQLWEDDLNEFLKETIHPKDDSEKDVRKRSLGGYGFPLPNGRMRNSEYPVETQDITSGATHALAECYEHKLVRENDQCRLNLLFDASNDDFEIKSYLPKKGMIDVTAKSRKTILIRVPTWVDIHSIKLLVNGENTPVSVVNDYINIVGLFPGSTSRIMFDIPCRKEKEMVDGSVYSTTWIGNQIIEIVPRGELSPLPIER